MSAKIPFLVMLFVGYTSILSAQAPTRKIDSLLHLVASSSDLVERTEYEVQIAPLLFKQDPNAAVERLRSAYSEAEQFKLGPPSAKVLKLIGDLELRRTNYTVADSVYRLSLTIYRHLEDKERIATLTNDLGLVTLNLGHLDSAQQLLTQALQQYETLHDTVGIASALTNLSTVHSFKGEQPLSRIYLNKVLVLDSLQKAWAYYAQGKANLGLMYLMEKDLSKAMELSLAGYETAKQHNDSRALYLNTANIGEVLRQRNDYRRAAAYLHESLRAARQSGYKLYVCKAYSKLMSVFQDVSNIDSAAYYFKLAEATVTPNDRGRLYNNWAIYQEQNLNDNRSAKYYYLRAIEANSKVDSASGMHVPLANLAILYHAQGKPDTAYQYLRRATKYRSLDGFTLGNSRMRFIGIILKSAGYPNEAVAVLANAIDEQQRNIQQLTVAEARISDAETKVRLLQQDQQIAASAEQQRKIKIRNITLIVVLLILSLVGHLLVRSHKRTKELARLNALNETLRGELHHRVANDYQSVASAFFVHLSDPTRSDSNALIERMHQKVTDMARLHQSLQTATKIEGFTPKSYLEEIIKRRAKQYSTPDRPLFVHFNYTLTDENPSAMNSTSLGTLAVIISEFITNSAKHRPSSENGIITTLSIRETATKSIIVTFNDHGEAPIPLSSSADEAGATFGLQMVARLCNTQGWHYANETEIGGYHHQIEIPQQHGSQHLDL